jgi:hypothetical protein
LTGRLHVKRPGVVHERDDRRQAGGSHRLQNVAIMRETFVAPRARLGFEPRPGERKTKCRAAKSLRELDVFAKAIPEVGCRTARNESPHALPNVSNIVATIVGFALVVGGRDAET